MLTGFHKAKSKTTENKLRLPTSAQDKHYGHVCSWRILQLWKNNSTEHWKTAKSCFPNSPL